MAISRRLVVFAAFTGALAVALGAFAAHGASPQVKTLLTTGAHYQMVHATMALACAVWAQRTAVLAGWLASIGGLVFGLALSAIGLLSLPAMGMVAPIGGALMIAGWVLLILAAAQARAAAGPSHPT